MEQVKVSLKDKAVLRNDLYNTLEEALVDLGMTVEPGAEGMIVHLDNGLFAEVAVTIKNEEVRYRSCSSSMLTRFSARLTVRQVRRGCGKEGRKGS